MEYSESWMTAETSIYNRLLTAAGSVDKVSAFRGYLPMATYNIWMFKSGGPGSGQHTHNAPITSFWLGALIHGYFNERDDALAFSMKIAQALPIKEVDNIQMFRFTANGLPDCNLKWLPMGNNQNEAVPVWEVKMAFDLIFITSGLYGATTPLAPGNVQASAGLYATKVALSWNAAIGATSYEVWRSTTNLLADATRIATPGAGIVAYDDSSAVAETVYFYWLKAKNTAGASVASPAVTGHATMAVP